MSVQTTKVRSPAVFRPLYSPARYKAIYGGRGSAKSHTFAQLAVLRAFERPGLRVLCVREIQKTLKESAKKLIEDKIQALGLGKHFDPQTDQIKAPGGGLFVFQGMQNHNAESIKSYEGFDIVWVEEAQTFSERSLELLRPTIRKPGSELWFSWNPDSEKDAVDAFFRGPTPPPNSIVIKANFDANPWFPPEMQDERLYDLETKPDRYGHIWLGEYQPAVAGAFYAELLNRAKEEGRIAKAEYEPDLDVQTAWDLGYTDDTAIWFFQWIWGEIRVIDYYASHGEPVEHYAKVIHGKPYNYGETPRHWFPHDAKPKTLAAAGKSILEQFWAHGVKGRIIPSLSVQDGIQAARSVIPICHFDAENCAEGLDALKSYRREYDADKAVFRKTPLHNWASHGADAFRTMAVAYKAEEKPKEPEDEKVTPTQQMTYDDWANAYELPDFR